MLPSDGGRSGVQVTTGYMQGFCCQDVVKFQDTKVTPTMFLESKYCKRKHHVARKASYDHSHAWRRLMDIKEAEKYLLWRVGKGNISFW